MHWWDHSTTVSRKGRFDLLWSWFGLQDWGSNEFFERSRQIWKGFISRSISKSFTAESDCAVARYPGLWEFGRLISIYSGHSSLDRITMQSIRQRPRSLSIRHLSRYDLFSLTRLIEFSLSFFLLLIVCDRKVERTRTRVWARYHSYGSSSRNGFSSLVIDGCWKIPIEKGSF